MNWREYDRFRTDESMSDLAAQRQYELGQRILRDATPPDDEELRGWIETAQEQQARDAEEDDAEGEDGDEDERSAA